MRPDESNRDVQSDEIQDLPAQAAVPAEDADTVKGGVTSNNGLVAQSADIVSPRDPATGLPTGRR